MKPADLRLIRSTLAIIWLVTGILSLGIYPQRESLHLLSRLGLNGATALVMLYLAATLDIALGLLTLLMPRKMLWVLQAILILGYTTMITLWLPEFWFHPFGPILKNLSVLALLWLLYQYEKEPK